MAGIVELIRAESDGSISFGNHEMEKKSKLSDFEHGGDIYKVKTYKEITKLEKNGMFTYESVPGTTVTGFMQLIDGVRFHVDGLKETQLIIGVEEDSEYQLQIQDAVVDEFDSSLTGKMVFSVNLSQPQGADVTIIKK